MNTAILITTFAVGFDMGMYVTTQKVLITI